MMGLNVNRLVMNLKSKVKRNLRNMKSKGRANSSDYDKIEKSESMRMELRSRKARKLIDKTLKMADSPRATRTYAF